MFNSVSWQHSEVWASQFPFLHSLRDVIPPSEACLYGHINWSLAQAQQQSSMGLSQSFPSKRGSKIRPQTGFHFMVHKRPVPGSSGPSLAKRPYLESGNEAHPSGKKSAGANMSTSSTDIRRKGVFICSFFQVGMLFKFFDEWRSITSNRFVLNMVWTHHLQLWSHPPLFHIFWQFNVKVATTHHPIIQKEVDELLAKGVIEPSSGGAGFYSSMYVVPKHTGGLWAVLNLKAF